MRELSTILSRYKGLPMMGSKGNVNFQDSTDLKKKNNLSKELIKLNKKNNIYFILCVIMVLMLFVGSLIFIIKNISNIDSIKITFGALGFSIMGLVLYMSRLWKEKVSVEMIIVLVNNADDKTINSVITILLDKLFAPQKII